MTFDETNPEHLLAVRQSLSWRRLAPYDKVALLHGTSGLRLYQWNTEASAACYASLQAVEVCLRNAIHSQLTQRHEALGLPGSWIDDPRRDLDPRRRLDIQAAADRLRQKRKPITPDALVAELSFGFWRYLLSKKYEWSLWLPALRFGFPHLQPQQRRDIAEPVERLHQLRNRIAHHEPIHLRDLISDHHDMMDILAAICPHTRTWARQLSALPEILYRRPVPLIPAQRVGTKQ